MAIIAKSIILFLWQQAWIFLVLSSFCLCRPKMMVAVQSQFDTKISSSSKNSIVDPVAPFASVKMSRAHTTKSTQLPDR